MKSAELKGISDYKHTHLHIINTHIYICFNTQLQLMTLFMSLDGHWDTCMYKHLGHE